MVRTARSRARVELARGRLHEIDLAVATGLEGVALDILRRVRPPDAPALGEGLVDRGGLISYVDGKRVGGDADRKPKDMPVRGKGIAVAVGFGFPARFQELGTVDQPPRPFLTPVVLAVAGDEGIVATAMRRAHATRLGKQARRLERRGNLPSGSLAR